MRGTKQISLMFCIILTMTIFLSGFLFAGKGSNSQSCTANSGYSLDSGNLTETLQSGYGFAAREDSLAWSSDIYVSSWTGVWQFSSTLESLHHIDEFSFVRYWNWNPDGSMFITETGDEDGIYNTRNEEFTALENLDFHNSFFETMAWGSDKLFVGFVNQQYINVWQVEDGALVSSFETEIRVPVSLSLNADETVLSVAGRNGEIEFYNAYTGELLSSYSYGTEDILSLEWHPQESWLIGSNRTGEIFRVDYHDGTSEIITLGDMSEPGSFRIEWSPDQTLLAIYGNELWIISASELQAGLDADDFINVGANAFIPDIAWSPDSTQMVTLDRQGFLSIWNVDTENDQLIQDQTLSGGHVGIRDIEWSPDGQYLATSGDGTVRLWDGEQDEPINLVNISKPGEVTWSPDSQYLATKAAENEIQILSMPDGELSAILRGHEYNINDLDWHPDGQVIASVDWDHVLNIWRVQDAEIVTTRRFPYWVNVVRWNDAGDKLFVGGNDGLAVMLDVSDTYEITGESYLYNLDFIHYRNVRKTAWQPASDLVAIIEDWDTLVLWDGTPDQSLIELSIDGYASDLAFSPDGTILFTAGRNGILALDAVTGEQLFSVDVQDAAQIDLNPCQPVFAVGDTSGILHIFSEP